MKTIRDVPPTLGRYEEPSEHADGVSSRSQGLSGQTISSRISKVAHPIPFRYRWVDLADSESESSEHPPLPARGSRMMSKEVLAPFIAPRCVEQFELPYDPVELEEIYDSDWATASPPVAAVESPKLSEKQKQRKRKKKREAAMAAAAVGAINELCYAKDEWPPTPWRIRH